jgi:hypothetical protein
MREANYRSFHNGIVSSLSTKAVAFREREEGLVGLVAFVFITFGETEGDKNEGDDLSQRGF